MAMPPDDWTPDDWDRYGRRWAAHRHWTELGPQVWWVWTNRASSSSVTRSTRPVVWRAHRSQDRDRSWDVYGSFLLRSDGLGIGAAWESLGCFGSCLQGVTSKGTEWNMRKRRLGINLDVAAALCLVEWLKLLKCLVQGGSWPRRFWHAESARYSHGSPEQSMPYKVCGQPWSVARVNLRTVVNILSRETLRFCPDKLPLPGTVCESAG